MGAAGRSCSGSAASAVGSVNSGGASVSDPISAMATDYRKLLHGDRPRIVIDSDHLQLKLWSPWLLTARPWLPSLATVIAVPHVTSDEPMWRFHANA